MRTAWSSNAAAATPTRAALWRRSGLGRLALERLATADALRSMELDRRQGLWALKALGEAPLPLFATLQTPLPAPHPSRPAAHVAQSETRAASLLPAMGLGEHVVEDYAQLEPQPETPPARLPARRTGAGAASSPPPSSPPCRSERRVAIAGLVLIRQRPGSANGVIFITIEDETGIANLIVWPPILERFRRTVLGATLLYCKGRLQREEGVIHVVAEDLRDLTPRLQTLRARTGIDKSGRKSIFALPERVPGHDPRDIYIPDIVIHSRDFR